MDIAYCGFDWGMVSLVTTMKQVLHGIRSKAIIMSVNKKCSFFNSLQPQAYDSQCSERFDSDIHNI